MGEFRDQRGRITDLVLGPVDCVTEIYTRKGAIRGNHVHKLTHQWTYIASGAMRIKTRSPEGEVRDQVWGPGSLAHEPPGVEHAWEALEDTYCIVITRGPRSGDGYESDTYRDGIELL